MTNTNSEIGHFDPGPFYNEKEMNESFSFVSDAGVLPDRSNEITLDPGLGITRQADGSYLIFHEWISVEERLPNDGQDLLMTYNDFVIQGRFANGKFFYPSVCAHVPGYCKCESQEGITDWMPLPKPPIQQNT